MLLCHSLSYRHQSWRLQTRPRACVRYGLGSHESAVGNVTVHLGMLILGLRLCLWEHVAVHLPRVAIPCSHR